MRNLKSFVISPNTIILRDNQVLLLRRADWAPLYPSTWHVPIGQMEHDESPRETAIRETREEVGLDVDPILGVSVWVRAYNFQKPEEEYRDLSLFYVVNEFEGEPENREPRLHDAMDWFEVNNLPDPIIPVVKFGIEQYLQGKTYAEFLLLRPIEEES